MVAISVIIPVYNVELFLEQAIDSVLNQTFEDIELICVNDGSNDNSLDILNSFSKKDSRVKIFNKENGGCGSARNLALKNATGDYIYFFNPDDYISPDTFDELYNNAINNDSDLVLFKIARFRDSNVIDYSNPGFDLEKVIKDKDFNNYTFNYNEIKKYVLNKSFSPWTKLYKHEFLDKYEDFCFDENIAFDDVPFHVKSMLRAEKISYIPDFFYYYRFNPNSVNNTSSNGIDIFKIIDITENFLKDEGFFCEFQNEFYLFKIHQIFHYILSTDSEEYFQLAKKELSKIDISNVDDLNWHYLKRCNLVLNIESFEEYKIEDYKLYIEKLKKDNEILDNKNKKLKRQIKKAKNLNKQLLSSRSWKLTEKFRR